MLLNVHLLIYNNFFRSPTPRTSELVPVEWLPVDDGTSIRYLNINSNLVMETGKNIEEKYIRFANLISLQM